MVKSYDTIENYFKEKNTLVMMNKKLRIILLILILLIGLFLRVHGLTDTSLWADELHTYHFVDTFSISELFNIYGQTHPPLYFLFMKIWTLIFGVTSFILRLPSVIFSTLTLVVLYFFAKKLWNHNVAIISVVLASLSNYLVNYAQEAKMYSLLWLLALLSIYYFYTMIKEDKYLWRYIITTTFALYTHYSMFIIFATQIIYILYRKKLSYLKYVLLLIVLSSPSWMKATMQSSVYKLSYIPGFSISALSKTLNNFSGEYVLNWSTNISLYAIIFLVLILFSIFSDKNENSLFILYFFLVPLILSIVISLFRHYYSIITIRFIGFLIYPYLLLVSLGINKLNKKWIMLGLVSIFLLTSMITYHQQDMKLHGENWESAISNLAETNIPLYVTDAWTTSIALRYYNPDLYKKSNLFNSSNLPSKFWLIGRESSYQNFIEDNLNILNNYRLEEDRSEWGVIVRKFQR